MVTLRVPENLGAKEPIGLNTSHWQKHAWLDDEDEKRGLRSGGGAIFHLAVKSISRGEGKRAAARGQQGKRSAVAAAAYRSGQKLKDERTGQTHDYSKRDGVVRSFILLPDNAPTEYRDREALWNAAEGSEKRKDAVVAREWVVALPDALPASVRASLAERFAMTLVLTFDVAADVSIHTAGKEGDQRNHHAHILTTSRVIGPEGFGEKTRELDVKQTSQQHIAELRHQWESMVNNALYEANIPLRISGQSFSDLAKIANSVGNDRLKEQLEDLQPTVHRGKDRQRSQPPRRRSIPTGREKASEPAQVEKESPVSTSALQHSAQDETEAETRIKRLHESWMKRDDEKRAALQAEKDRTEEKARKSDQKGSERSKWQQRRRGREGDYER